MGHVSGHENGNSSGTGLRVWVLRIACALRSYVMWLIGIVAVVVAVWCVWRVSREERAFLSEQTHQGWHSGLHVSVSLAGFDPYKCTTQATLFATAAPTNILRGEFERAQEQPRGLHISFSRMAFPLEAVTKPAWDVVLDHVGNDVYSGQEVADIFLGETDPARTPFFYPFDVYGLELDMMAPMPMQEEELPFGFPSSIPIDLVTVEAFLPGLVVQDFEWWSVSFKAENHPSIVGFRLMFQRPFLNRVISLIVPLVLGILIVILLVRATREEFVRVSAPLAISIWGLREVIMPDSIHWPTLLDVGFMVLYLVLGVGLVWRLRTPSPAQGIKS